MFSHLSGVKAVDSWTEKAYEAPTTSEVGYKHYYLGCPGNERTSDVDHNNPVTLEQITIPALTALDPANVDANNKITLINEAKIKWFDQSTTLGTDGGTAQYVLDQGHQALFFSRSNNLSDSHSSEFRFSFSSISKLTSISFDYRYLDYNTTTTNAGGDVGQDHIFTQVHNSAYNPIDFDFVNDDEWHHAVISKASSYTAVVDFIIKIHDFQGHFFISNLEINSFDELGLQAVSGADAIAPVTLSDVGIADGTAVPAHTSGHVFGSYDFYANKGIDIWFKYQHTNESGAFRYFYLFNQDNEDGIVFRLNNRNEDDGYVPLRVYTVNAYSGTTTVVQGCDQPGTIFWFPYQSGIKTSTSNIVHVRAYCIDETNNTFRCEITMGVEGGIQRYPSTLPEDGTNTPMSFDIELGSAYFDGGLHRRIRFSASSATFSTLYDATSEEQVVVYKDYDGTVLGKKASNSLELVNYNVQGKTLVGWFDHRGNRVRNGDSVTGKLIVKPVFTDTTNKMVTLTDYGLNSSYTLTHADSGFASSGSIYPETGNSIDFYYTYKFLSKDSADNYFIVGLPFDEIDEQSRIYLRIDNPSSTKLSGYIYGKSLGIAGAEGTSFSSGDGVRSTSYDPLLVHINLVDNGSNNVTITINFLNLVTGATFSQTRTTTFAVDYALSSEYAARNRLGIIGAINCTATIESVF